MNKTSIYCAALISLPMFASADQLHCKNGLGSYQVSLDTNSTHLTANLNLHENPSEIRSLNCFKETELTEGFYICESELNSLNEGWKLEFLVSPVNTQFVDIYKVTTTNKVLVDTLVCRQ